MKRRSEPNASGGYTLLELLAYIFVFTIIVNTTVALFLSTKRIHALGEIGLERIERVQEVESDFRESVLNANAFVGQSIVPGLGDPSIVLRTTSTQGKEEFSVWHTSDENRIRLSQYRNTDDGLTLRYRKTYSLPITSVAFIIDKTDTGDARTVRMDLAIIAEGTPNTTPAENTVIASLGGWNP